MTYHEVLDVYNLDGIILLLIVCLSNNLSDYVINLATIELLNISRAELTHRNQ